MFWKEGQICSAILRGVHGSIYCCVQYSCEKPRQKPEPCIGAVAFHNEVYRELILKPKRTLRVVDRGSLISCLVRVEAWIYLVAEAEPGVNECQAAAPWKEVLTGVEPVEIEIEKNHDESIATRTRV